MAEEETLAIPPAPPAGEIVSNRALLNTQYALYRNTLAFGGVRDPSTIWASMLRDDGSAILYYRELEEKDVDVANALNTLKGTVMERDWMVEPADDDSLSVDVANFVERQLANVPDFDSVLDNILDAAPYGFSVQESIFDTSEGQAELADIRDCPQELFLFNDRFTPQIGPLQFLDSPYASTGKIVPEQKFLITTYRGRSRNRMGRPLLRTIFWPSWFKRNVFRLWAQYAEKGPGTAVVRYNDSNNPAEAQQAADLAKSLIEQVAVAVPMNFDYDKELLTIARALDPTVFDRFTSKMELSITRFVLGETLTSFGGEGGKGTQALGDVHADTLQTKSKGLCKMVMSVVNRQLIRPLVLWNYGPKAPMPVWKYDIEEKEDQTKQLSILQGAQRMGVSLPQQFVRETFNIPAPEGGELVLTPNIAAAPGPQVTEPETDFAEGERELAEFDKLAEGLQEEAFGLFKERVGQVTRVLERTEGR